MKEKRDRMKRQPDFNRDTILLFLLLLLISGASAYPGSANTTALLQMNGTHGSNGFLDETGNSTTNQGGAILDTTIKKFGNASGLFVSASKQSIDLPAGKGLQFAGDFTIDGWYNASSYSGSPRILGIANTELTVQLASQYRIDVYVKGNNFYNASVDYPVKTWHYFKLLRRGSTCDLYIDATQVATYASCTGIVNSGGSNGLSIGTYQTGGGLSQYFAGHIDQFRIQNGYADLSGVLSGEDLATASDTTPPASIQGLGNTTVLCNETQWNWTNPLDPDLSEIITYKNGAWLENLTNTTIGRRWTGLSEGTDYTISTHTKDLSGNVNSTWVNATMQTATCGVPPTPTPTPGISGMYPRFDSNETAGSAPFPVSFYDESIGNITNWFWSFGDGNTATDQNPEYVFNGSGIFDVSLSINGTDGNGTFTKNRMIKVIGGSPAPAAAGPVIMPSTPGSWDEILGDRIGKILDVIFGE